ncbi:MAG TPA: lipid-binding SYLF domain-containing protein [Candidatus Angelobacter sp.]
MKNILLGFLLLSLSVFAFPKEDRSDATNRLNDSAKVLDELMGAADNSIPDTVLAKAKCVAVIPSMVKGGFIVGGRHGRGEVTCRTANGWSSPAFISLTGGSWGAQIGVEKVDLVLVFMNDKGVNSLLKDNFKMGADASVAAGPLGRHAEAATDANLDAEILAYSRAKGLFAGVELNGAAVKPDNDSNNAFYGSSVNWHDLVTGNVKAPAAADPFVDAVHKYFVESRADKDK